QGAPLPGLSSVLRLLREGGLVIYFRHAATDQTGTTDENADLAKCETQRPLSAEGREQAARIGDAFRKLRIKVGAVTTSPLSRCKDTAQIAFGHYTTDNDLVFALKADAAESSRLAGALRSMLSTRPMAGTNAVIVSHTANLREAAGIWPKPEGVAYIFRPLGGGRFEMLAKVLPEDWAKAANATKHS